MDPKQIDQIKMRFGSKDTAELIEIWKANNREAYSDEAFEAIKLLLGDRSVALPQQSTYVPKEESVKKEYVNYNEVPWHRRSGFNSLLILINFLTGGFIPGILLVCIFVLTGDIYYRHYDNEGNLKTWGWGNKIAAVILLIINIAYLGYIFMR